MKGGNESVGFLENAAVDPTVLEEGEQAGFKAIWDGKLADYLFLRGGIMKGRPVICVCSQGQVLVNMS